MLKRLDAIILIVNANFNYFFGRILYLIFSGEAENMRKSARAKQTLPCLKA